MALLLALLLITMPQTPAACGSAAQCREQALAAAASGDYETFHDLAWRAVQKGRPNDPELMYLLARAQALSGRPGDALVMLQRLVDMGASVDVTTEDFRRVRVLKGWPELEARMAGRPAPAPAKTEPPGAKPETPAETAPGAAAPAPGKRTDAADATEEALTFEIPRFDAVGLAYDAVSRRFIVGDRSAARLIVIDEVSRHVTNLVSAASAGFYDRITAFEIDARRGDLWVASASKDGRASVLHKLQLVSGRVLDEVQLRSDDERSLLADVAIAADGAIVGIDRGSARIVRLRPRARAFEEVCKLSLEGPRSLALADDRIVYVSSDAGIAQLDLSTCAATAVRVPRDANVTKVDRMLWQNGGLVLMQRVSDAETRLARARLDASGRAISRLQTLALARDTDPRTSTIAGADLFYFVFSGGRPSIRKTKLR